MKLFLALVFACASLLCASSVSELEDRIADEKKELSRMRSELEEGRRKLKELAAQARDQETDLVQVESNVKLGERLLASLDSTETLYRELVGKSQTEAERASAAWRDRRRLLALRIRQMYVKGRPSPQASWIGKSDPSEWGRTLADFRAVVKADRNLMRLVKVREAAARKELASHRRRVEGLQEISEQKRQDLSLLEQERQSKAGALSELRSKEQSERERLAAMEASQKVLEKLLQDLERRREKAEEDRRRAEEDARKREEERKRRDEEHRKEVAKRKKEGKPPPPPPKPLPPPPPPPRQDKALAGPPPAKKGLCWPVQGPVVSKFGLEKNPVLGTVTRNLGVEIGGKADQKVVSAAAGRVAAVTELPGRGNTVILEHPGGYFSIYGQLGRTQVSVGQAVSACSELGRLAPDNPPRVYFEYRHNLKAEDPLEWLTK